MPLTSNHPLKKEKIQEREHRPASMEHFNILNLPHSQNWQNSQKNKP